MKKILFVFMLLFSFSLFSQVKDEVILINSKYEVNESSGWKTYRGSNKPLLADLNKGDKYEKIILQFCFSKAEMTFYETRAIACSDCMLTEDCYNDWFSAKVYKSHLIGKRKE